MKLALISDPHLGEPVGRWATTRRLFGRHDTTYRERLQQLVDAINAHPEPLHTIVLGDITDRTMEKELKEAVEVIGDLEDDCDIVIGNHDVTSVWKMAPGMYSQAGHHRTLSAIDWITGRADYPYVRDFERWRLICLDTSAHGERGTLFARGRIGDEQIAFLAAELAVQKPTWVAGHHYIEDVEWALAVEDADQARAVMAREHVTYINGHRHRAGEYPRTADRPRILTSGQSVETMRFRVVDPVAGQWEWLGVPS